MLCRLLSFLLFICFTTATLSSTSKKKKAEKKVETPYEPSGPVGPIQKSVFDRGLVSENVEWKDIVNNHAAYYHVTSKRAIKHMTLAYVTPWNNHGYDVAKSLGGKFTHVSPVWLQLKRDDEENFMSGEQDIDQGWIKEVRKAGKKTKVKIVPRIIVEGWQIHDYQELLEEKAEQAKLTDMIINTIKKHQFDGIVLEIWSQLPSRYLTEYMPKIIKDLATKIRKAGYTFILVIPPPVYRGNAESGFTPKHFRTLVDSVDAFSLMTYDYSSFDSPGPNSPVAWMMNCVQRLAPDASSSHRAKILLGINLYGLLHSVQGGEHVLGKQFVDLLAKFKPPKISYDDVSQEHFLEFSLSADRSGGRHTIFYPTLHSINVRVQLAKELGTGLSLWEIGQGLDYFYDLF